MKLKLQNLSKSYNKKVIDQINFSEDIHTLALIGRSGCGKSTLLRMIGGLIASDEGEIILDGEVAKDHESYRKQIGFVFQQGGLFSHLSARENITVPLMKVHHLSEEQANKRADELLTRFGLLEESEKKPAQLSGGQRQRISIARAVAPKPKILLLDEPTSALDPEYTTEVLNMIKELKGENLSFIIATHEMGFALHACDQVIFLSDGKIAEYGKSEELFSNPKISELKTFLSKLLEWRV